MTTPHSTKRAAEPSAQTLRFIMHLANLMVVAFIVVTVLTAIATGEPVAKFLRNTVWLWAAHFGAGSFGNAGAGFELKMPTWFVIFQSSMQDTIIVCYVYSLFAWAYKRFSNWPVIGRNIAEAHKQALDHSHIIRPWGVTGLVIFVIVPMWATGPIVGTIIGYIIGLGAFSTLVTISVSCALCSVFYVFFYEWLREWNPGVALGIMGVLLVFATFGALVGIVRYLWVKEEKIKAAESLSQMEPPESESGPGRG